MDQVDPRAAIARTLKASARVLVAGHLGPDGDCLGSGLALAWALRRLGSVVTVASADGVPSALAFLPGAADVVTDVAPDYVADAAVTMECSTVDRAGRVGAAVGRSRTIIAIDHHAELMPYAHLADWDQTAAAVGEQVADLIHRLGVPVDPVIALCLQTAVVTDTGVFRYANTTPRVLRLAADLAECGAPVFEVVSRVYEQQPASALRLLGQALAGLTLHHNGAVAVTAVTPEMLASSGATREAVSGIAALLRTVAGVRLSITFEEDEGIVRVSLRSRDGVRADRVAQALGGGGHPAAAGAEVPGRLDAVVRRGLAFAAQEIERAMGEAPADA